MNNLNYDTCGHLIRTSEPAFSRIRSSNNLTLKRGFMPAQKHLLNRWRLALLVIGLGLGSALIFSNRSAAVFQTASKTTDHARGKSAWN
jgi:hypothetical protein